MWWGRQGAFVPQALPWQKCSLGLAQRPDTVGSHCFFYSFRKTDKKHLGELFGSEGRLADVGKEEGTDSLASPPPTPIAFDWFLLIECNGGVGSSKTLHGIIWWVSSQGLRDQGPDVSEYRENSHWNIYPPTDCWNIDQKLKALG